MPSAARAASATPRMTRRAAPESRRDEMRTKFQAFEAGRMGRRLRAIPSTPHAINSQIKIWGKNVIARSRWLSINNPYAASAKDEFVSALVGNGIKPSSLVADKKLKKIIQRAWLEWTDEADADGLTDFYGIQAIVAAEMFEAGECFIRLRKRYFEDGLTVPLQLQVLPSEMLDFAHNEALPGGARIECGIEFNAIGQRVAYHFFRNHPGEDGTLKILSFDGERTRVPASQVLHMFRPIRAGQVRGVPHTLAGIATLAMIDLYDDAELERKRIAALFGAFVTRGLTPEGEVQPFAGAVETLNEDNLNLSEFTLEPGAVVDLGFGQDIKFAEPADVGTSYEPFEYRNLLRAAAGFGVTYSGMTGDYKQANYSSIRAGEVKHRRKVEQQQHQVMAFQMCRPIWALWFKLGVEVGAFETEDGDLAIMPSEYLAKPKTFTLVKWIPPKWDWVDPLKDRQAEKLAVDSGFKSRGDVIEAEGYDPEEVDERIKQDQDRAADLGIKFVTISSGMVLASTSDEDETSLEVEDNPDDKAPDDFFEEK